MDFAGAKPIDTGLSGLDAKSACLHATEDPLCKVTAVADPAAVREGPGTKASPATVSWQTGLSGGPL